MKVAVVIPTRNRANWLKECVNALLNSNGESNDYEILVVNNGSVDSTEQVCKEYESEIDNFSYINCEKAGLHVARNIGFQKTDADIIAYIDDDVIVKEGYIKAILKTFEDDGVLLAGGNVFPEFESAEPEWYSRSLIHTDDGVVFCLELSSIFLGNEKKEISPLYVFGCNFIVRRSLLEKAGGFHPDGVPDDYLLFRGDGESYIARFMEEHGHKAMFDPELSVKHFMPDSRCALDNRNKIRFRTGISNAYHMIRYHSYLHLVVYSIIRALRCIVDRIIEDNTEVMARNAQELKGAIFLLRNYYKYHLGTWINRDNYLNENGYIEDFINRYHLAGALIKLK